MSSLKRFATYASAVALATGTTLTGAGLASAQDDTGGLSSAALGDIGGQLETAADALNSPVTVSGNADGGPTVTYTNEGEAAEHCLGFTAPYSTIVDNDLDTDYDDEDLGAAIALVQALEAGGGVTYLLGDEDGAPTTLLDTDATDEQNFVAFVIPWVLGGQVTAGVDVEPGEDVTWTAGSPDTPALAVVACMADEDDAAMATNIGIDPQVVADQMNDILPGGSVTAGSISGGSVEMGANLLGSLGDVGGENGDDNDDNDDNNNGD